VERQELDFETVAAIDRALERIGEEHGLEVKYLENPRARHVPDGGIYEVHVRFALPNADELMAGWSKA
jgi:hypothetical protein